MTQAVPIDDLPFFITGPDGTDIMFGLVTLVLILVLVGFGALYFTIQSIPDRMVDGTNKTQLQIVGILGLISLVTFNNAFWVAGLLLAAVRLPDFTKPVQDLSSIRKSLAKESDNA